MQYVLPMNKRAWLGVLGTVGVWACSSGSNATGPADASAIDAEVADDAGQAEDTGTVVVVPDDAGNPTEDTGVPATLRCGASLTTACVNPAPGYDCPPSLQSALPGPWCAAHPTAGSVLGECVGYTVLSETVGGVELLFLYSVQTGSLSAVVQNGTTPVCIGGTTTFQLPLTCLGSPLSSTFDGLGASAGCTGDAGPSVDGGVGDGGDAAASDASSDASEDAASDASDAGASDAGVRDAGDAGDAPDAG
jgi:hypothetical protein